MVSKGFGIVASLAMMGFLARSLDSESFGIWVILFSVYNLISFLDLGLATSLRNKLSILSNKGDESEQLNYFFSLFYSYVFFAIFLSVILSCIGWALSFKWPFSRIEYNYALLIVLIIGIFNSLPFALSGTSFYSYLETYFNAYFDIANTLFRFIFILCGYYFKWSFIVLVIFFYLPVLVTGFISLLLFLKRRMWAIFPSRYSISLQKLKSLISEGILFAMIQASVVLIGNTSPILVGYVASIQEAGDFSFVQKLFLLLVSIHITFIQPYWSAYTLKYHQKDKEWIKKSLSRYGLWALSLFLIVGVLLVIFGPQIIYLWTKKTINNRGLYITLMIWALINLLNNHYSVFLSGINRLRRQAFFTLFGAAANIPLSIALGRLWGVNGVICANIFILLPLLISNILESQKAINVLDTKTHLNSEPIHGLS